MPPSQSFKARRSTSGLVGFGSSCSAIQPSTPASSDGLRRTPTRVPFPVGTGPRFFFSVNTDCFSILTVLSQLYSASNTCASKTLQRGHHA